MLKRIIVLLCSVLVGFSAQAAIVEVDVTIKAVDAKARGITVAYETTAGKKSIDLDISRKAEVTVNGASGTLDSLRPGQKAKVTFEKEIQVVTKIIATGNAPVKGGPLIQVSELKDIYCPSLSENGMTIYFHRRRVNQPIYMWTAHRKDAQSFFEDEKRLFEGAGGTVTNDGLEMVLHGPGGLCSATRASLNDSFRRPELVPELDDADNSSLYFSADGLALFFTRSLENPNPKQKFKINQLTVTTRSDRRSKWSKPKLIEVDTQTPKMMFPCVTPDGMTLLCVNRYPSKPQLGNLYKFTRPNTTSPFSDEQHIDILGLPTFLGRFPRYVPATKELFFMQADDVADLDKGHLIIVKNFVP